MTELRWMPWVDVLRRDIGARPGKYGFRAFRPEVYKP